ncbi:kinase-like domain-containing protein [Mycena sanguinolenta]|nr:kinase-like domain-containing protein [Mycena sanguinolenta]
MALNANNGELMAVKRVETSQTASERADSRQLEIVEALKFESNILKDLEHPNIVQCLGFEETPYTLNIFLEYVPGGTIGSCRQKHGKFDQDVTKWFTSQILAGLEYLHSTGILHRDLKGDNILVQTSGVCKISNFEMSKKEDVQGQAFTGMKGTVFWMAPEVLHANNKQGYDSKVDIWSVGCVVLEMWTGERPWAGEEIIPVMLKLYTEKLPPPIPQGVLSGLSELALDFHRECFAMDPRQRPTAAVLRNHPYLQRTPSWVFQLSDIERSIPRSDSRDNDSTSGTMWKEPLGEPEKARAPAPSPSTHRRSHDTKRESTWAPRPGVQEIYSHLQEFFPSVDLDKPIIATTTSDPQQRTKSIRMTIEELNRANSEGSLGRATTKLWGHKVEEVTTEG